MKKALVSFVITILSILLSSRILLAELPERFNHKWQEIESIYHQRLKENNIVGSSMIFVADGQIIGQSFNGMADLDNHRPVNENTIYHWASITKTFTAIAIMQLRDQDLLDLEDPIVNYIPELRQVYNAYGDIEKITLHHLMTHTSGFRNPTWPWGGDKKWHPHEPREWSQLVAMFPYTEILFEPGSQHSYSNPGIIFLGRVIEIVSGDDYEVYMDKNVFKPLKMYKTYYDKTPYHLLPFRSNNYYLRGDTLISNGLDFDTGITVSNGGMNAPLGDMVKYLSFLLGTEGDNYPILERESLKEMWETQFIIDIQNELKLSRGLSFLILENDNLRIIGHTGGQKGFISFFYIHPESKTGAIVVFNTQVISGSDISKTRIISAEIRDLFIERLWPLFIN
jgi:CubicO group peptidase (beta-lactamase class C family)